MSGADYYLAKQIVKALYQANQTPEHCDQRHTFGDLAEALKKVIGEEGYKFWIETGELPMSKNKHVYERENIGPAHPLHTGSGFTEVLVTDGGALIAHFTGNSAKRNADAFVYSADKQARRKRQYERKTEL